MDKIPYLKKGGCIKNFECIKYEDVYEIYNQTDLFYTHISYIVNVKHINEIGKQFNKIEIIDFNDKTEFTSFLKIFSELKN